MFLLLDELMYQQDFAPIQREVKHSSFLVGKKAFSLIRISKSFYNVDLGSLQERECHCIVKSSKKTENPTKNATEDWGRRIWRIQRKKQERFLHRNELKEDGVEYSLSSVKKRNTDSHGWKLHQ